MTLFCRKIFKKKMALFVAKVWIPRCEPKKTAHLGCEPTLHFKLPWQKLILVLYWPLKLYGWRGDAEVKLEQGWIIRPGCDKRAPNWEKSATDANLHQSSELGLLQQKENWQMLKQANSNFQQQPPKVCNWCQPLSIFITWKKDTKLPTPSN